MALRASSIPSPSRQAFGWLFKRARAARAWILLSVGLGFSSGLLLVAQARLLAHVVDRAVMAHQPPAALRSHFAALLAVIILRAVLGWSREMAGFCAGATIRSELRLELMTHVMALGPGYTGNKRTGALASTILEQVESLHDFFAHYLPQLALAVMIPGALLAFVFPLSWAAGGLLLATAPLIPLFMVLVGMGAESVSQRHFQALARLSAHFLDVLQGLPTLKLFDRSREQAISVAKVSSDYRKHTMRVLRIAFLSSAVLEFFSSIAIALVAVYLGMGYLGYIDFGGYGQPLTLAGGLFILLLAPDFYLPLRELGTHYHARAAALGASQEILKILSEPRPAAPGGASSWPVSTAAEIHFQDVHLAFDGGRRPALRGVSFELKAGQQIALVGPSGAGKTTILNLLLGFLQPDYGQITANGKALDAVAPESWRRQLAWLGQNPMLFHGSIRENIRLGLPEASHDAIERAADAAGVLRFTRHLPDGLETHVGEQGSGLSRGQAQRIALARAFLKDAPILLLDEPTANLDMQNEQMVLAALRKLSRGKTLLWLTHRLSNIESADRILVLAEGRLVEQGTHAELVAAGGVFRRLYRNSE